MGNFFLYETQLPAGNGFQLFGPVHWMWLLSIAVFTGVSSHWYKKQNKRRKKTINHIMGIVFPGIAIYRDIVLILTGYYDVGYLPLHLCGMALWIGMFYCITGNRFLGVIYVLLCVPGAIGALLFPDWNAYPFWNYMHIHDFVSHGLIVTFGFWLLTSRQIVPKWKDFWMPTVFGIAGMIILQKVNRTLHTNFWFLNRPSAGSPLVWIFELTGEKWYLVGYFLFCVVCVSVWKGILSLCERLFG